MIARHTFLSVAVLVHMANPNGAGGQGAVRVSDAVSCGACAIDVQRVATLPDAGGRVIIPSLPPVSVALSADGYYMVGPIVGDSAVAVYDSFGTLRDLYGRFGPGPVEFPAPNLPMIIRTSDSGRVYAINGRRMHILAPRMPSIIRSVSLPLIPNDALVIRDTLYAQWPVREGAQGGTLIQVVTADGSVEKGIARTDRLSITASPFNTVRRLSSGSGGAAIWSAQLSRYELNRYDAGGREVFRLIRDAPWFPPYDTPLAGELFIVPQRPRVEGILEAPDGLLWIVISHGADPFRPIVAGAQGGAEVALDRFIDFNRLLDTTIEVVDPKAQVVVARRTVKGHLRLVSSPTNEVLLFAVVQNQIGETAIDVFRAALRGFARY